MSAQGGKGGKIWTLPGNIELLVSRLNNNICGFVFISRSAKDVELNIQKGHILRSKLAGIDEGGVSSGGGMADSPYLIK